MPVIKHTKSQRVKNKHIKTKHKRKTKTRKTTKWHKCAASTHA